MPEHNIIKYGCTKQVKDTWINMYTYGNNFNYIYMTCSSKWMNWKEKYKHIMISRHVKEFVEIQEMNY
jgi:hypothetical protein